MQSIIYRYTVSCERFFFYPTHSVISYRSKGEEREREREEKRERERERERELIFSDYHNNERMGKELEECDS